MYDMHGQGVPVIAPIDQNAAIKAVMTDSKLSEPLYNALGVDVNNLKKSISQEISRGIASGLFYDEIARNIQFFTNAPLSRAKTIVRTEAHRIQEASAEDARQKAKARGADVVKQWDATLDGNTRPTHRELDGQIRELDKPFEANGKKAMYPGDFGVASEDCNCRCVALTRARAALDEDELKILRERAVRHSLYMDDPKTYRADKLPKLKNFTEFKKSYLKAAETEVENRAENKTKTNRETAPSEKTKEQEKPSQSEPKQEVKQPAVSIGQENQRGSNAIIETYAKRLDATGVRLVSAEDLAKMNPVDYGNVDPRAAEACNKVLEKYAGRYNSWIAGVNVDFREDASVGGTTGISGAGGTGYIKLNGKQMKDYDRMVKMIENNGLEGHGVKVKPGYYDQYVMTHEYGHTLLNEEMTRKSNVGVENAVYKKAMKEAKQAFAEYQHEYHYLSNRVIELRNEEIKLNDAYMDEDADILELMGKGKKLVSDLKEAEEQLSSVTISHYANIDVNEFIAEAWTEREIGENPSKYSLQIGEIIDKYFKF
jgi:SPP1 gp7 family putative phage head morphogenesis protein